MDQQTITMFVLLALFFGMFYFLIIRPQRQRQKDHANLMSSLVKGDGVITIGGIHGVIESVAEDSVIIKVESGTLLKVSRGAIGYKKTPEDKK
ncbi:MULTISPECIES: preprotein translocase subunit YajC [Dehalococcoides]|jgi:preprotein translocase subunit YajC|uniref:preprotein translocase subunit YajC n=1 Tax=Dehalococcoides TaxID=61434 RepID=UPI0003C89E42|nr:MULTISPECIES: preprotein translocase subunit YajC [Dehalococcoides]AHB13993.1 preprotein translocase subunit YajC [Dehalococcoides mccartyi GY50]AII58335.1 preprotein translocase subunit YajC [Dehalococcoides mccartyi CG1]APH12910.1 preprotein translocase subunit YajC [Dehalococcoides mccartyi]QYY57676.1 preprotein translocase subunit YajC [Dehalococcoides mccartyi]BAQ35103.1 hypothetical protein UCH007_11450 [Dehalococcoides sp. UCH007]